MSRLPDAGPLVVSVAGLSGVSIAGASSSAVVAFVWPSSWEVVGLFLAVRSGVPSELAALRLSVEDDANVALLSDGSGLEPDSFSVSGLGLMGLAPNVLGGLGFAPRWLPLSRRVRAGDRWRFQLVNDNPGAVVPELLLRVEVP